VPFGSGYASFLEGKVVDMFYFPLIVTTYPDWVPFKGGQEFIFFSPVFNFADSCISVGVVLLLLFYRKEMEGISETVKTAFKKK
jgi:signal peptidase II